MKANEKYLPGKIAVESTDNVCRIYENSDSVNLSFLIRNDDRMSYGGFTWLNQRDALIGCEYISGATRDGYKGNIVVFNLNGQVVERLYEAERGEIVGETYSSRNDKYLLFVEQRVGGLKTNPLEGLTRQNSILIMDLQSKQIIEKLENIGASPNFHIQESPWLPNETEFIYDICSQKENGIGGEKSSQSKNDTAGIYIYDLRINQKKLLIPDACFGICSPLDMQIAYIKDQSIWVMNLKTDSNILLYKAGSGETLQNIHWTPDGKNIYLAYFSNYAFGLFTSSEKLIDLISKTAMSFKKIGQGFGKYTWK